MNCSECNHELTNEELRAAAAEFGRLSTAMRRRAVAGPGRAPVPAPCPECGIEQPSAANAAAHCSTAVKLARLRCNVLSGGYATEREGMFVLIHVLGTTFRLRESFVEQELVEMA